jgi:signal transduction histidine kinase
VFAATVSKFPHAGGGNTEMDGNSALALEEVAPQQVLTRPLALSARSALKKETRATKPARQTLRPAASSVVMVIFSIGLGATLVQTDIWDPKHGIDQVLPLLSTVNVCLALVASWVAFLRWRHDGDLLACRLAVAIPSLFWSSQAIARAHSPIEHILSVTAPPSILRIVIGAVGTGLISAQAIGDGRALTESLAIRVVICVLSIVTITVCLTLALRFHLSLEHRLRVAASSVVFPLFWSALAIVLLLDHRHSRRRPIHFALASLLLLLSIGQITNLPGPLSLDQQAAFGSGLGTIALVVLLVGLGHELRSSYAEQQRALIAFEIDRAVETRRREAEVLLASRRTHDQRAALLSVEAVLRVLEGDGNATLDPIERRRLSAAATSELQRLRSVDNEPVAATRIDIDLRTLLEPMVSLARADGANVTMDVRPGLMASVSPTGIDDVMRNLILNAVQHGSNSAIVVDARRLDYEFIEFSVSDRGPGISPLRRFDLFEAGRTSGGNGHYGLGLDSARSLLRDMGGDLTLDRSYVLGARFVGKIPVARHLARTT